MKIQGFITKLHHTRRTGPVRRPDPPNHITILLLAVCGLCLLTAPSSRAAEVPVEITLKDKQKYEGAILGRAGSQYLRMSRLDTPGEIRHAPGDIAFLEFPLPLERLEIDRRYGENKFNEVAVLLGKVLAPTFPYLDIPNNATPQVLVLLDSLYWNEDYKQALRVTDLLEKSASDTDVVMEARLYKVLCLLAGGDKKELETAWSGILAPEGTGALSALYWFTKTQMALEAGDLEAAQISAATLVAFHTKDFKWMPAGLYHSAKGYGKTHRYVSASHAIRNLQMGYPKSLFRVKSVDLFEQLTEDEKAYESELARAEEEARAEEQKIAARKKARYEKYLEKKNNREIPQG